MCTSYTPGKVGEQSLAILDNQRVTLTTSCYLKTHSVQVPPVLLSELKGAANKKQRQRSKNL